MSSQSVTHILNLEAAAQSSQRSLADITNALNLSLRMQLAGSSQIGVSKGGGQWFITLAPDCPAFAAVSDGLNHGGAIPFQ